MSVCQFLMKAKNSLNSILSDKYIDIDMFYLSSEWVHIPPANGSSSSKQAVTSKYLIPFLKRWGGGYKCFFLSFDGTPFRHVGQIPLH